MRAYTVLDETEIARLIVATRHTRDRAIVVVLLGSGLRVSECVALDVTDVLEGVEGGGALRVREGKGRKPRTVPVRSDVMQAIRAYLDTSGRVLHGHGPLFRSHDRGAPKRGRPRLSARSVQRIVNEAAARAGIRAKHVSPHALRHSFAIRCLRAGANTAAVAELLGHASVATTQTYLRHLALGELRESIPLLPTT